MTPADDRSPRRRPTRVTTTAVVAAAILLAGCSDGATEAPATAGAASPPAATTEPGDGTPSSQPSAAATPATSAPAEASAALAAADVQAVLAEVQVGGLAEGEYEPFDDQLVVCGAPGVSTSVGGGEQLSRQLGTPGQEVVLLEAMVFPDAAAAAAAAPTVVTPESCEGDLELEPLALTYAGGLAVDAGDAAVETTLSGTSPQLPDGAVDVTWVVLQGNVVWKATAGSGTPDEARSRELLAEATSAVEAGLQQG